MRSVGYSYYNDVSIDSAEWIDNEVMSLSTQTNFWYDKVNLANAWNYTQGSPDVKVGVIDASFYAHSRINDNLWINSGEIPNNSIDDDGNGFIDDYAGFDCENLDGNVYRVPTVSSYPDGHGLGVAGLIAGEPDGVYPYLSVAPQCKLFLLYSQSNVGSTVAVQYAIRNNVQILNKSQESSGSDESFLSALQQYKGLFVCGAGNDGLDLSDSANASSCYPSQYALGNMICVTGMNKIGTFNSEYNYGNTIVDVAAPCRSVNVCSPSDIITNMDNGWTSCATPIVTGIAALLKSYYPSATTEMIKHAILFSVQKGSTFSGKVRMGGYVNAENALQLLETQMPLKPNPTTPFFIRNKETGQYLTMQSDKSITQTDFTGNSNQQWILSNYNNGYYVIQSYQNQTYRMDVDNASSANGTIVKAHVYTGYDDAQSFRFQQTTDGNYYIYPKVADGVGRCLQINGTDKLRIYNNNALTTQQWCLQSSSFFDSSQTYYLRNKYTGRYLTVTELESGGYSLGLSSYLGDYSSKGWKFTTDGTPPYKQVVSAYNSTLLLGFDVDDYHSVSSNYFYHYANVGNSLEYNDLQ